MPQPMPPPAQGSQPPQGQGDAQGQVAQMIQSVGKGLEMISQIMDKVPDTPPEAKDKMAAALENFNGAIEILTGGGQQEQPPQGPSTPEQGGAPGAVPASPAGMPRR